MNLMITVDMWSEQNDEALLVSLDSTHEFIMLQIALWYEALYHTKCISGARVVYSWRFYKLYKIKATPTRAMDKTPQSNENVTMEWIMGQYEILLKIYIQCCWKWIS